MRRARPSTDSDALELYWQHVAPIPALLRCCADEIRCAEVDERRALQALIEASAATSRPLPSSTSAADISTLECELNDAVQAPAGKDCTLSVPATSAAPSRRAAKVVRPAVPTAHQIRVLEDAVLNAARQRVLVAKRAFAAADAAYLALKN
jgi:hypothetical protein